MRKLMIMDKDSLPNQINTRMIKLTTGMLFMTPKNGANNSLIMLLFALTAAKRMPTKIANKKPLTILTKENPIVDQKEGSAIRITRVLATSIGDTKSKLCPIPILASCQTTNQNNTTTAFW